MFGRNIWNYTPRDRLSLSRGTESAVTLLWEPQISLVWMSCISTLPDWVSLKEWGVCLLTMYMSSVASTGPQLPDKAVFPQASIPQDFLEQLYMCASLFKDLQVSARVSNVHMLLFIKFGFAVILWYTSSWLMAFSLYEMFNSVVSGTFCGLSVPQSCCMCRSWSPWPTDPALENLLLFA